MTQDDFKGSVHYVAANLATTMCLYNAMAFSQRKERRLAINTIIYLCLLGFETYNTYGHWRTGDAD